MCLSDSCNLFCSSPVTHPPNLLAPSLLMLLSAGFYPLCLSHSPALYWTWVLDTRSSTQTWWLRSLNLGSSHTWWLFQPFTPMLLQFPRAILPALPSAFSLTKNSHLHPHPFPSSLLAFSNFISKLIVKHETYHLNCSLTNIFYFLASSFFIFLYLLVRPWSRSLSFLFPHGL